MRLGETVSLAGYVRRKTGGASDSSRAFVFWMLLAIAAVLGAIMQHLGSRYMGWPSGNNLPGFLFGAAVGVFAITPLQRRWDLGRFRREFRARGHDPDLTISTSLGPDRLSHSVGGIEHLVQWPVVTELFRIRGYWVFVAQGTSVWMPRRFFPDAAAERAFIAGALSYMSDAARRRSGRAEAFVRDAAA